MNFFPRRKKSLFKRKNCRRRRQTMQKTQVEQSHVNNPGHSADDAHEDEKEIYVIKEEEEPHTFNTEIQTPLVALPPLNEFAGPYDFTIKVDTNQSKNCFAEELNKLYTNIDTPCIIQMCTATPLPQNCVIRTTLRYSESNHFNQIVTRCVRHLTMENSVEDIELAPYIVRCQSNFARYSKNTATGDYEVGVPFINPSAGECHPKYVYKFMCLSSCIGGMNRRPVKVIFTIEQSDNKTVLGRQALNLKICKCPQRDITKDLNRNNNNIPAYSNDPERQGNTNSGPVYEISTPNIHYYRILLQLNEQLQKTAKR